MLKMEGADDWDAILFESMVICEYLEETHGGDKLYSEDALSRAQQRVWIEYGTATQAEAWQFLNAKDRTTADAKWAAVRNRLERLEDVLDQGPTSLDRRSAWSMRCSRLCSGISTSSTRP
ncbi:glutathione S-transferase family protein [Rhizobium beringeri]|uniref:glutathione S-transferase family protein n=1 Tax=Rhizobium beringeri TaxID=3019934 RepID=UPI003B59CB86